MTIKLEMDLSDYEPDFIARLEQRIERMKHAHVIDIRVRINGEYRFEEGDFIKRLRVVRS